MWMVVGSVALMLALQAWFASGVVSRTSELRDVLSDAHVVVNKLERNIGYGGLIHNFKNYVLRGDDADRVSALKNSEEALILLERLHKSAQNLGIDVSLKHTREMVLSYTQRLEQVHKLSANGLSPLLIDQQVRFNDTPAIQEVGLTLAALEAAVSDGLEELQWQGTVMSMLSTAGATVLGIFLVGVFVQRQRRHTETLQAFADQLSVTNNDLNKANTSLNQFAGIVSHDLKSPVRYMQALNQLIVEDAADASLVKQHIDSINRQGRRIDSIIDSLLDFTQNGFSQLQTEAIHATCLFADLKCDLQSEIDSHHANIEFKAMLDTPVMADRKLLSRVFINLIGNSLKYARVDGPTSIVVCAESDDGRALFSVSDNGIGIEAKYAQKIFEPMMRLHGPNSPYQGVGIGLSLVKSIVESHGGLIWLDTEFSQGTRFIFSLPFAPYTRLEKAA